MTPPVLVLGHRGMLGHVVARYLREQAVRVVTLETRFTAGREDDFLKEVEAHGAEAIVNCIGVRPSAELSPSEMERVNGVLPQRLASGGGARLLVQPSSDGVFSGRTGPSKVDRALDAEDPYGSSKRAAERSVELGRTVVFRTSIVGPELGPPRSLLGWLCGQSGSVRGFTDQLWNGITTLSWAELCLRAIRGEIGAGIHQPASSPALSKGELLETIRDVYGLGVAITLEASDNPLDRRLVPTHPLPPIREQLVRLREWYEARPA